MQLLADNVEKILIDCLFKDDELDENNKPKIEPVVVTGIVNAYAFHPARLHSHARDVRTMLTQLPDNFHQNIGGGWSFLNMCMRSDGEQWTGLHQTQEHLAVLAIGLGMGSWLPPDRKMWGSFPGSVPYFIVNLGEG